MQLQLYVSQFWVAFVNSWYKLKEMCLLVETKTDTIACRMHMLTRKSVRNVETTNVHTAVSFAHGHVPFVTDVRTKRHWTCPTVGLFCLDIDLMTNGHELRPTIGRQCDELTCSHVERMVTTLPSMSITR